MGRKARFRRVASTPITLKLDGIPTKIPSNGTFISTIEMVGSLPGVRFEGFIDQEQTSSTKPCDPIREWNEINAKALSPDVIESKIDEIMKAPSNAPEVTSQVTPEVIPQDGLSLEVLMELKSKDNRAWAVMTKKELKAILKKSGVDFSHVPDDRNKLYKFLSEIVKRL